MSRRRQKPAAAKPASRPVASTPGTPHNRGPLGRISGVVLLLAAAAIAAFLAWHSWRGSAVPGCSEQAPCHSVIGGRWGQVLGIPVSVPGAVLYLTLAFLGIRSLRPGPDPARRLRVAGAVAAIGGAAWFTAVQAFILHAFCPWCCTAHALAVTGALLLLTGARRPAPDSTPRAARRGSPLLRPEITVPAAAVAALALLQATVRPPEKILSAALHDKGVARSGELLSLHGGTIQLDPREFPVIGSPGAAVLGVVLADFTCPHCRALHLLLEELAAEDPGRAAFVLAPGSRSPQAAEVHRILRTVWQEDPVLFDELVQALNAGVLDAEPQPLLQQADTRLGGRFYELAWKHAAETEAALQLGRRLLEANDATLEVASLPQLMIGDQILTGEPRAETLRSLLAATAAGNQMAAPASLSSGSVPAAAPPAPLAAGTPSAAGPRIEFLNPHLDLPEVARGEQAHGVFRFRNAGGAPLQITQIKPSCGCTAVEGWDRTVAPGAEGSFAITLDTAKFSSKVTKSIDVLSNAVNTSGGLSKVSVTAHIWMPVQLNPSSAQFGTLVKGRPAAPKKIEVTVTDPQPLQIGTPTVSNPAFAAALETIEAGRKYLLTVSVSPESMAKPVEQGELTLPLGHPRLLKLSLPLYARAADPVEALPREIVLPAAPLAAPQERFLTVQCHDREHRQFAVTGIEVAGVPGATAVIDPPPAAGSGRLRVKVTLPAGLNLAQAEASGNNAVILRTNHPEAATVTVPIRPFRRPTAPPGIPAPR